MAKPYQRKDRSDRTRTNKFTNRKPWKKDGAVRDGGHPTLHPAVCSQCGNNCVVPFKPNGKKPIFCSNCFKKKSDGEPDRFSRPSTDRRFSSDQQGNKDDSFGWQLKALNAKLDAMLNILRDEEENERPSRSTFRKG
ncbi:hypothetical protein COV04_01025 [Candidatus Uhrbacteria bacterium CG10_big_fil_rev_8_21_14_0_10_48_11]|uniref:CxxC-x17-CxxC domain-containing protein n=1 Tax=Candidatus Uhrbacteria bacterium CG10_big_fil_rev_8_21_14_0_10_48_11 TaxID=1975037 RepID=A0A2M8LFC8_9BACT|nr:MAG: hypothetical protein COV04_01025 [Candidatus Uhrbacteria bacterium CG10_big_fil_rev_8_21_14_0_10_48_11]